jgi:regulator of sigma E protease
MSILLSLLGFVLAIGLLVAVHEYGHFQVARWCGVKVLRFSIGFGKPLWTKIGKDGVEYQIAAVPLGGYVKMLDEREGEVAAEEKHLAFNTQSVWKRIAVVAAGPLANFLFAIFAWWLVFILGVTATKPELGDIQANTPAAEAGLQAGDVVTGLNGDLIESWETLRLGLIEEALTSDTARLSVMRGEQQFEVEIPLLGTPEQVDQAAGLQSWRPEFPATIGQVVAASAAETAGLLAGDEIKAVDSEPVANWSELVAKVQASGGKLLQLDIVRGGVPQQVVLVPERREIEINGEKITRGFAGVGPFVSEALREEARSRQLMLQYGPIEALGLAVNRTGSLSWLTLGMFGKMLTGGASIENIGGPVQIAAGAGATLALGITAYLGYLALISISLGVLNLLPVPVLDGGHLLYYFVEIIKGSPVSLEVQAAGQRIGLALLLLLMGVAFYNDFTRLL